MKKTLLIASSNGFLKTNYNVSLKIAFAIMLFIASFQNTNAQCIGPYQNFESVPQAITPMITDGWVTSGTSTFFAAATTQRTGRNVLVHGTPTTTNAAIATPLINTPANFTFYVRGSSVAMTYAVDFSDNGGTTWFAIPAGTNSIVAVYNTISVTAVLPAVSNTAYSKVSISGAFPDVVGQEYRFRIRDTRSSGTSGAIYLDDLSYTSSVPAENLMIVAEISSTSLCNIPITPGLVYQYYDNGGKSDSYSPSQLTPGQQMSFTPTTGTAKIKITQGSFATEATLDYLEIYNSDNLTTLLSTRSGNGTPFTPITSTAPNGALSTRFVSNAGLPTAGQTGYFYTVEALECNTPNTLAGVATYAQANLSWVGSGSATQYEVFQATSATPVPTVISSGTLTGSVATSYNATGLTPETTYYFWVRSVCGASNSDWTGPVSVKPICSATTVPYLENFNGFVGGVLPPCTSSDNPSWATNSVNGNLFTNADYSSFFTKGVSLTAGQLYRISYDYSTNGNGEADLEIYWGTTNFTPTFGNINTPLAGASHYNFSNIQSNIVNFTAPTTGTYYLNFFQAGLYDFPLMSGTAMNIDNIKIEIETCLPPTIANNYVGPNTTSISPYLTAVDDFTANISWNVPATGVPSNGYFYFVSTSNIAPAYLATPTGSTPTNSVLLTGLSPNTRYFVWARANCGGQISTWSLNYVQLVTTNVTAPVTVLISDVEPFPAAGAALAYNNGCNFVFADSGGVGSNYSNNENHTYTFRPALGSPAGTKLKVTFSSFNVEESWDGLLIYSGDDSGGNTRQLMTSGRPAGIVATCPAGSYRGTASPGTLISNAANGSLSFTFTSDSSVTPSGWTASIVCVIVPAITSFTPTSNACGTTNTVVITGTNFTGATGVFFGLSPAVSFVVNSPTQITAVAPSSGSVISAPIKIENINAFGYSITNFTLQPTPPTTTGVTFCPGGSGVVTSPTVCDGYTLAVPQISASPVTKGLSVTLGATPTAIRPNSSGNSTVCGFLAGSVRNYNATDFQVSLTGSYTFFLNTGSDMMGYIARNPFAAGTCSTNFVIGDDDSGPGLDPQMTITLNAGVTYTLFTTSYGGTGTLTGTFTWNINPPIGGNVLLFETTSVNWYSAASGGTLLGSGASFDPIGVAGSGVLNNTTPVTTNFYAACSSNSTCRTATPYVIVNPGTIAPATQTISCTGTLFPLVLSSSTSTISKWQYNATDATFATGVTVDIPGTAGATTLTVLQIGSFSGTRYYRAQTNTGSCITYSNVASITIDRAVWNGSWTGTPSATAAVEFQSNYTSTGDLNACSVTVTGGNVIFATGHTLTVQNTVTVTSPGTLTFQDESSLYQPNSVANAPGVYKGGNTGNITYNRTAAPMNKMDYTYWSPPVYPQNLLAVSPLSPQNYFLHYTGTAWSYLTPSSTTMTPAKGYLIRAPLDFNPSPGMPSDFTASFVGEPNNGAISIPVIGGSGQLNLIGNPYPSALSAYPTAPGFPATGFLTANTNLNGALYFWTHNTPFGNFAWGQYNPNDYAIYNLSGASTAGPLGAGNVSVPTGLIASGQGFFVEGLSSGNANFTNAMRRPGVVGVNDNFYRTAETNQSVENGLEKHRYWLDIINANNDFKQVLIGYIEGATNGLDRLYDAKMVDINSKVTIYTKVDNTLLTIQGKELAFNINEQIPLYFNTAAADTYTISLSNFDGLFLNQNIYLEDTVLNVIHNLKESSYTFASNAGLFENRFRVRYTTSALGVNDTVFNENSVIVYKNEQGLVINSGTATIKNVTIYDIAGRQITAKTNVNNVTTTFTNLPKTQQVLLVKIESEEGTIVTKKVVF